MLTTAAPLPAHSAWHTVPRNVLKVEAKKENRERKRGGRRRGKKQEPDKYVRLDTKRGSSQIR